MPRLSRRAFTACAGSMALAPTLGHTKELTTAYGFNDEGVDWHLFDAGLAKATAENKPIFYVAHATWCGHCSNYRRVFFKEEIIELLSAFVPILVDTDMQPEVDKPYKFDGGYVPRTMFLDPDGTPRRELTAADDRFAYFVDYRSSRSLSGLLRDAKEAFDLT